MITNVNEFYGSILTFGKKKIVSVSFSTHPSTLKGHVCWRKPLSHSGCGDEEHRLKVSVSYKHPKGRKKKALT